jgi:hypothetical protein
MAGEFYTGTLLASPIVRGSSGDTYPTHHSTLGSGGFMEVNTIAERNALPIDTVNGVNFDGISSGQRRIGMLVYVHSDDTIYQLKILESTWSGLTTAGKLLAIANNSNWVIFVEGGDDGTSDSNIKRQFEQLTHGFSVGDVIGYDGSVFVKVSSLTAATIEALGIITNVIDANNFNLTFSGYISTVGITDVNSNILTGGTVYYLANVAGELSPTAPTGTTELSKPMLVALSADTGVVLQYRGLYEILTSGGTVSYNEFTGYTATTQLFLDTTITGATNLGFFSGTTGMQTLPIDHLTDDSYDGSYVSVYNNFYRDDQGVIRIGVSSDGIAKRGYVRSTLPAKSLIWNEYTGDTAPVGWIFINDDVSLDSVYGSVFTGTSVSYSVPAYINTSWVEGNFYNNGSQIVVNSVIGNFLSGGTYVNSGPVYRDTENQSIGLRTIVSETPQSLKVEFDEYFIKLSGHTSIVTATNVGGGIGVYSGVSGTSLLFKTLVGDGDTTITDLGTTIQISSTGSGGVSGGGENVTKRITQSAHGFALNDVIGWSGGTYNKAIADSTYDGEIVGVVSDLVNVNTFDLTQSGYLSGLTGLAINTTYYLSDSSSGQLTTTAPTALGSYIRPVLVGLSTTDAWVFPYQAIEISSGITTIYDGKSPSTCEVGGMIVGTTLTGRTVQDLLEEILVPTINPTISAPFNSFSKLPTTTQYEVGCLVSLTFTSGFNKGSICLSGSFQNYRSGEVNSYYYDGSGLPTGVSSTSLSDVQNVVGYVVSAGTQTWNSCVGYDCGPQPLDSDGCDYSSPLPSGTTSAVSTSITGIYPYFWGIEASGGAPAGSNRPIADNDLVTGGTKVVATSDSTVCVNFNSTADDYLWFAIPTGSTSKTCWYVDVINNGGIGGGVSPGCNLFPDLDSVSVCTVCWCNQTYKVYISNYQSSISSTMQLRNS